MTDVRELACSIAELFDDLLKEKKLIIPCSDPTEKEERHDDGNNAALYGMEYWSLVDAIEAKLLDEKDIPMAIVKTIRERIVMIQLSVSGMLWFKTIMRAINLSAY